MQPYILGPVVQHPPRPHKKKGKNLFFKIEATLDYESKTITCDSGNGFHRALKKSVTANAVKRTEA